MRWFRTNRMIGGRLALFALALQLVLAFGHIHHDEISGSAQDSAVAAAPADRSATLPADHSSKHNDDYCPICATSAMLGNSSAAQPPQLPLPFIFHAVEHGNRAAAVFVSSQRTPFRSRAPPAA